MSKPHEKTGAPGRPAGRRWLDIGLGERLGREFTKLWLAAAVSGVGDGIALVAAPLLAASMTGDPRIIAGFPPALTLPYVLFSLPAGVLTDRVNKSRAMALVDAFRAVIVGGFTVLVVLDQVSIPVLYVCFFLIGSCETFFRNTSQALVPQVVKREGLALANGRMIGTEIVTLEFLGPMVGGLLFAVSATLPFGVDAASFAISSLLLWTLRPLVPDGPRARRHPQARRPRRTRFLTDLIDGLRVLWRDRVLRSLAVIAGLSNFVSFGILAILVVYARNELHIGNSAYGVLLGSAAVGGLIASRLGPVLARALGSEWTLFVAVAGQVTAYLVLSVTDQPVVAGAALAVAGAATVVWNVVAVVLRQTRVSPGYLGRVNSIYRQVAWGALPVGSICGGFVAHAYGTRTVCALGALLLGMAVLYLLRVAVRHEISAPDRRPAVGTRESVSDLDDEGEVVP